MAEKDEKTVEVEDDGTVTVDITDNPDLANVKGADDGNTVLKEAKKGAEEVEVEAEPEKKVEAKPAPKAEKKSVPRVKLDDKSVALQESLASSEKQRKAATEAATAEQQRRIAAEQRAAEAAKTAVAAREEAAQKELNALTGQIEGTQRELSALEAELARLFESGEFAKAAATQTKIGRATAALDRLEASKATLESNIEKMVERADEASTENAPANAAPMDQYLASQNFAPEAQIWLRAHPDCLPPNFGGKQDMNAKMMAGHYAALGQNVPANSPKYFEIIEQHIGERKAAEEVEEVDDDDVGEEQEVEAKPAPKKAAKAQPSAPPSREAPTGSGSIPRTTRQVSLNKDQQEAARISFPHLPPNQAYAAYARNLLELEAEGKMGRLTH